MTSRDAERQELERAIEQLGRSTRHGRLLEFLGTKYFSQQEAQLTEFDIAREVFGRSLDSFDPAEDAVVRVEVHRLRKKLRDIYEKDARAHGVQISLPAGTYVPKFTAVGAPEERRRRLPWAWIVAGVGAVAIVVMFIAMGSRERTTQAPGAAATSAPAAVSPGAPGQIDELHIM